MTSLADLLDGDPRDVVVHLRGETTTRAELSTHAEALGARLRELGLEGTAIGVVGPNVAATIAAWFAVWRAGAAFVPLNPRVPGDELEKVASRAGVAAVVSVGGAPAFGGEPHAVSGVPFSVVVLDRPGRRVPDAGDAIVQMTSGTTGEPKPVPLRHDTVRDILDSVIGSLRGSRPDERARMPNLVPLPLCTWGGIYQVLFAFRLGVPVVLMERFEPLEFARLVAAHGIRSSVLPPAALVMLTNEPAVTSLAPLRYVRSVSAPLSPAHARRFHERFGVAILNGYGQTELGGEAIGWTAADWKAFGPAKLGAVGRPHAAFSVRVRSDDGSIAATDEVGELEIRSSSSLPADDPALAGRVTPDGWLRTGDLGRVDTDGFVWIDGRVSAMINRGGMKVFPDEVEEHLRAHPDIVDVAVAGVPDDRLGEVPWAFVVTPREVDPERLRAFARERMAPYKVPAGVTVVDALPRNEMGKVLRGDLVPLAGALGT